MRTSIAVLLLALIPAAAHAAKPCDPNTLNTGTVKIEVDPATGAAVPDTCRVKSGTVVKWKSGKSFQTRFNTSPNGHDTVFKSHKKIVNHVAEMTAVTVGEYPYYVETQQAAADPTIIIDP